MIPDPIDPGVEATGFQDGSEIKENLHILNPTPSKPRGVSGRGR